MTTRSPSPPASSFSPFVCVWSCFSLSTNSFSPFEDLLRALSRQMPINPATMTDVASIRSPNSSISLLSIHLNLVHLSLILLCHSLSSSSSLLCNSGSDKKSPLC
ncbi:hypothetical protein AAHE18_08G009900 [Arachis hypogaea]